MFSGHFIALGLSSHFSVCLFRFFRIFTNFAAKRDCERIVMSTRKESAASFGTFHRDFIEIASPVRQDERRNCRSPWRALLSATSRSFFLKAPLALMWESTFFLAALSPLRLALRLLQLFTIDTKERERTEKPFIIRETYFWNMRALIYH